MGFQNVFSLDDYQIKALVMFRMTSRMDTDWVTSEYPYFAERSLVATHTGKGVKITGDYILSETISHNFSRIIPWEELLEGEYTIKVNLEEMQALLYIIGNAAWDADTKSQEIRRKKIEALYGRLERKTNFPAKAMQNFKNYNYTEEK